MKKRKSKGNSKRLIYASILTTFLLVAIGGLLVFGLVKLVANFKPFYETKERTENITKYNKTHEQTKAVAWIRVQGTNIDYPVIYSDGTVNIQEITEDFTWVLNDIEEVKNRIFVLGHNIRNVSRNPIITDKNHTRFEQLPSFMYLDFIEDNKYVQFTINGKDYLYKIFSVSIVKDSELSYQTTSLEKEDLKEYIDKSLKESYYDFDIDIDENDNIITLATCTRFYGYSPRYTYKIDARMVRDNEKIKNYKVEENNNYKEIQKTMKGGVEDEGKL